MRSPRRVQAAGAEPDALSIPRTTSEFVVGVDSAHDSTSGFITSRDAHPVLQRMLTVGAESDFQLDYVGGKFPRIRVSLIRNRLVAYVVSTAVFFSVFTAVTFNGIVVHRVTTEIGVANDRADELVELYNTISGFVLALVEGLMTLVMHNFLSVYLVYLHNTLWFLHRNDAVNKASSALRATLMVLFPVLFLLLISNSVRSLQASQSTVGFEYTMTSDDLRREQPLIEVIKDEIAQRASTATAARAIAPTIPLGILGNAVRGSSVPFQIITASACSAGGQVSGRDAPLNIHDLDATNVVYGFSAHEWNTEALSDVVNFTVQHRFSSADPTLKTRAAPSDFNLKVAFEMFVQGKIVLDKGVVSSVHKFNPCDEVDADARCAGMKATLVNASKTLADRGERTPQRLVDLVATGLGELLEDFNRSDVSVLLQRQMISSQIRLDMMTVEGYSTLVTGTTVRIRNTTGMAHTFGAEARDYCGSQDCVFLDETATVRVPHQVVVLPSHTNCKLTGGSLEYSRDLGMYHPTQCDAERNAFLAVGTMTYISGDEYGSSFANYSGKPTSREADGPYIINPRRNVRLVMARYTWVTEDLATSYGAMCNRPSGSHSCKGLALKLPQTGRYVFASEDALPSARIAKASFASPHRLVQLNQASIYSRLMGKTVVPERLNRQPDAGIFKFIKWSASGLGGTQCSRLMSSYLRHVELNSYVLDRSTADVYRAALLFLFSSGSVTDLRDTSALVNASLAGQRLAGNDSLEHVHLKGDVQLRAIRVSVPAKSFAASLAGCVVLVAVTLVVLLAPSRRLEYFPSGTSDATKYIAVRNPERYPNALYRKTLLFPATREAMTIEEFAIEELRLRHKVSHEDQIVL